MSLRKESGPSRKPVVAPADEAPARRSVDGVRPERLCNVLAPHLPQAAARQNIASYAHLHGVVLTRKHRPAATIAPAALCRILREAIEATTEGRRERAETVVCSIAMRIIEAGGEPLAVPQVAIDVLRRLTLAARLADAAPAGLLIEGSSSCGLERPADAPGMIANAVGGVTAGRHRAARASRSQP